MTAPDRVTPATRGEADRACGAKEVIDDLQTMRAEFFALCATLAKDIPGDEVIRMLKEISEDVYTAGIDQIFAEALLKNRDNVADAFDFTWLTALAIKLNNWTPHD